MTLRDVMERAQALGDEERTRLFEECDGHTVSALPTTETGGGGALHYCRNCWTLFTASGVVYNPFDVQL